MKLENCDYWGITDNFEQGISYNLFTTDLVQLDMTSQGFNQVKKMVSLK